MWTRTAAAPPRLPVAAVGSVAPGRRTAQRLVAGAFALVVLAHVVARIADPTGRWLINVPPVVGHWDVHAGWGSLPAVACIAVAVALDRRARTWPWRRLLVAAFVLSALWTASLALVDGPWGHLLERRDDYLFDLPRITDAAGFLRTYTDHVSTAPDAWTTHVAAHPPLATLVFWGLARVGLPGGFWGGLLCILVGSGAGVAWASTLARLGSSTLARRAVVPLALTPAAVWVGVSGDGLFAGVAAIGTALACRGALTRSVPASLVGGLLLGAVPYLSYGLALFVLPLATVVLLSVRAAGRNAVWRGWSVSALSASVPALGLTAAGFDWWRGLTLLHGRYYDGVASLRPQWYFVWADPAAVVVCLSPVVALAVWAAVRSVRDDRTIAAPAVALLPLAALAAMAAADLSGMSKAETERIWLPFALAVPAAFALLPPRWRRTCLVGGAVWALAVNHLVRTGW